MSCTALASRVQPLSADSNGVVGLCVPSRLNNTLKVFLAFRRQRVVTNGLPLLKPCEADQLLGSRLLHVHNTYGRRGRGLVMNALPVEAISAGVAIVVVTGSVGALVLLNQGKGKDGVNEKQKCVACDGSGLCPSCNGEGFQLKNLSPEAASRARANAKDAATRYTAGLAKKWSYCTSCSGSRNCSECSGSGSLKITPTRS